MPKMKGKIDGRDVVESGVLIFHQNSTEIIVYPVPEHPNFSLVIDIVFNSNNISRTRIETIDGRPSVIIQRPWDNGDAHGPGDPLYFGYDGKFKYYINFVTDYLGEQRKYTCIFNYMVSREAA